MGVYTAHTYTNEGLDMLKRQMRANIMNDIVKELKAMYDRYQEVETSIFNNDAFKIAYEEYMITLYNRINEIINDLNKYLEAEKEDAVNRAKKDKEREYAKQQRDNKRNSKGFFAKFWS